MTPRAARVARRVVLLGVGGVGKTTLIYRILGAAAQPRATLRPGVYRIYARGEAIDVIDVPGQRAAEVAWAARRAGPIDRALLVYDVTRPETLNALEEVAGLFCSGGCPAKEVVVVGNKRDLAEELGYMVENVSLPYPTKYISALKDPPEVLLELLL